MGDTAVVVRLRAKLWDVRTALGVKREDFTKQRGGASEARYRPGVRQHPTFPEQMLLILEKQRLSFITGLRKVQYQSRPLQYRTSKRVEVQGEFSYQS